MLKMLDQSLQWMAQADTRDIVKRLDMQNKDASLELIEVLNRHRGMYAGDVLFSKRQIEATAQFMRAAGILTDASFDINSLIAPLAGVKP